MDTFKFFGADQLCGAMDLDDRKQGSIFVDEDMRFIGGFNFTIAFGGLADGGAYPGQNGINTV